MLTNSTIHGCNSMVSTFYFYVFIVQQWTNASNQMAVMTAYLSDAHNSMDPAVG